ncbi:MAG: hypothetical protein FWC17_05490 [Treponema sp.]|nr:hypothetical protein [Treponema sp.]
MITITCDICKKKIDNAEYGRSFFYYASHSICEPCKDNLEVTLKSKVRGTDPYETVWYEKFVDDSINKAIQKGKI